MSRSPTVSELRREPATELCREPVANLRREPAAELCREPVANAERELDLLAGTRTAG